MSVVDLDAAALQGPRPPRRLRWATPHSVATHPRLALYIGAGLLMGILVVCWVGPALFPEPSSAIVAAPLQAPSSEHLFGTDSLGRDVLARALVAGRLDLAIAVITVGAAAIAGSLIGVVAGLSGPWIDTVLMRVVDALLAFPFLVLVLALVSVFGSTTGFGPLPPGAPAVMLGIALADWTVYARLARAQTLSLRQHDFVQAARLLGYSRRRLVLRHLMPGVLRIIVAYAAADAILVLVAAASMSFIGLGVQAPAPEWGSMIFDGRSVIDTSWWISCFPGAVLVLSGIGFSLVSDGLLGTRSVR